MRFVAHPVTGLYVTVHSSFPLPLSAILSGVGNWSTWPPTDWPFWGAFRILVACNVCSGWGLEWCMHRDSDKGRFQLIVSFMCY
jgi:hypothetical protein